MYKQQQKQKQSHHRCLTFNEVMMMILLVLISLLLLMSNNSSGGNTVMGETSTACNCSLREWLSDLNDQAHSLQSTSLMLEKAINVLNSSTEISIKDKSSSHVQRTSQLLKINSALGLVNLEIKVIETKCNQFDGPDCDVIVKTCDSKCKTCTSISISQCTSCYGNFEGESCSVCKSGWNGLNCSIPICDAKCLNCSSPGNCATCLGNFEGVTCSTCKSGWNGLNCSTPICDSKCTSCSSPGNCATCSGNFEGVTCSTCKSGWTGSDCNTPICDLKCTSCSSPGNCATCSGNFEGGTCSVCKSGWNATDCNTPVCDSKCTSCTSPGNCATCSGNWNGVTCSTCKSGWTGSDCNTVAVSAGDITTSSILTSATHRNRFMNEIMNGVSLQSAQPTLLFRATIHGFSASAFHTKCDNKGANIVIVKSASGAIFGGYTTKSWTPNGSYVIDSSAFMFSLISSTGTERFTKLTQENGSKYKNGYGYSNSVYQAGSFGPTFGGGYDMYISNNANTVTSSSSNVCFCYCDTTIISNSPAAQSYLAGSNKFLVYDYEVYTF